MESGRWEWRGGPRCGGCQRRGAQPSVSPSCTGGSGWRFSGPWRGDSWGGSPQPGILGRVDVPLSWRGLPPQLSSWGSGAIMPLAKGTLPCFYSGGHGLSLSTLIPVSWFRSPNKSLLCPCWPAIGSACLTWPFENRSSSPHPHISLISAGGC